MRSIFILKIDLLASIETNLEFLEKCKRQIKAKEEQLKKLRKTPKNQIDLEDNIKEMEDQ